MRSSPARVMGSNVLRFGDLSDEEREEGVSARSCRLRHPDLRQSGDAGPQI